MSLHHSVADTRANVLLCPLSGWSRTNVTVCALAATPGGLNGSMQHFVFEREMEVYAHETDNASRLDVRPEDADVGSLAARVDTKVDRAPIWQALVVDLWAALAARGHPTGAPLSLAPGPDTGRARGNLAGDCGAVLDPRDGADTGSFGLDGKSGNTAKRGLRCVPSVAGRRASLGTGAASKTL